MIINSGYANSITGDVGARHVRLPELDESSLYTGFIKNIHLFRYIHQKHHHQLVWLTIPINVL